MLLTSLNLNGTRSALKKGFSSWLARARPQVLCLQEVRAFLHDLPAGCFKSYQVNWNPAEKPGYAGTAILVADELFTSRTFFIGSSEAPPLTRGLEEGRFSGARVGNLEVWSVYFPSGSSGPERQRWKFAFLEGMAPWLESRKKQGLEEGFEVVVVGDINIAHTAMDIKNAKGNEKNSGFLPEERAWLSTLFASGWRDGFREKNPDTVAYSWWSNRGRARENNVGWRLDQVWVTPGVRLGGVSIEREAGLSDHAPLHVELVTE